MLRSHALTITILASGLAFGESAVSFEYRGVRTSGGGLSQEVHLTVIRRGDDLFVQSNDADQLERYLQVGNRAVRIYWRRTAAPYVSGTTVLLTDSGLFSSILHFPYLPDVEILGDLGYEGDQQRTFLQLTGGSLLSVPRAPGEIFRMPVVRRSQVGQDTKVYARLEEAVWAEVSQGDFVQVGPWEIPGRSVERYRDGRGEYRYEWTLVQTQHGEGVPELPTFESLLASVATEYPPGAGQRMVHVQDERSSHPLAFHFLVNGGSLEEQLAEAQRIDTMIEAYEQEAARLVWQRRAPWLVALAGALALGVGALVYWRRRGTPS